VSPRRAAGWLALGAVAVFIVVALPGLLLTRVLDGSALARADARGDTWLAGHRSAGLNTVTYWVTLLAETLTVALAALIAVVALALALRRWREPLFLALAVAGEVLLFLAVTAVIDRHRPPVPQLDPAPLTSSYPSGHTAAAIVLYGGLVVLATRTARLASLRLLLLVLAVVVAVAVAFARMYRGMHFPTDVLGGAVLGSAWLAVVTAALLPRAGGQHVRR
jgi:membrane-associated phospholipid phosphatase